MSGAHRIAYLFGRYPNPEQPFCDTELLALRSLGVNLEIDALSAARLSFRHELTAEQSLDLYHLPPHALVKAHAYRASRELRWPHELAARHEAKYGPNARTEELLRHALTLASGFERRGVTHVHAHFVNRAAKVALFLKRLAGFPFSVTVHGLSFIETGADRDLFREIAREAEFVVAVSNWSLDRLRELCPESAHKLVQIHNGLDPERFAQQAALAERACPRIVSVGRLIELKGFSTLVAACAELRAHGREFECTVVGEGPSRPELEAGIRNHGLEDCVKLTGLRTQGEIRSLLRDADVFVLASQKDGTGACDVFPTVILEAMATGLPVVATRLGGVPELVEDGVTGLLVEPGNGASLAQGLETLLESRVLRREHGAAGRRRLEERFTSERAARALRERFVASETNRPPPSIARRASPTVTWLVDRWPPPAWERLEHELEKVAAEPEVQILTCSVDERFDATYTAANLAVATSLETLPDASALEATWLSDAVARARIERLRERVPRALRGESYYRDARRALWIAGVLRRRGVRHLHAARASSVVCAWLVKHLTEMSVTCRLGPRLASRRHDYELLRADFDAAGVEGAVRDPVLSRAQVPTVVTPVRTKRDRIVVTEPAPKET